jgi:hypothetical protein
MWLMNAEPLIGNFDPWAFCFAYGAFRLEHSLCLVEQRTHRPSCHARRTLVRRFNLPRCYLDVTRLCGILVSRLSPRSMLVVIYGDMVPTVDTPSASRCLRHPARIPVAVALAQAPFYTEIGELREDSAFLRSSITIHSTWVGENTRSWFSMSPLRGPDKEPSFPISHAGLNSNTTSTRN